MATGRFNEWDPYASNRNERQKSPLKSKQGQQSGFSHSFLGQDSSPRQPSGRLNIGSATQKFQHLTTFQQQYHQQQLQQQQQSQFLLVNPLSSGGQVEPGANNSSTSNLDLVISGQKLGPRKESPTNTPRDSSAYQQRQQESSANSRGFARRLQPIEKNSSDAANVLNSSGEGQIFRQKTGFEKFFYSTKYETN